MISAAGLNDDIGHQQVMSPSAQPGLPNGERGDHGGRASEHGEPQPSGSHFNPEREGASVDESTEGICGSQLPPVATDPLFALIVNSQMAILLEQMGQVQASTTSGAGQPVVTGTMVENAGSIAAKEFLMPRSRVSVQGRNNWLGRNVMEGLPCWIMRLGSYLAPVDPMAPSPLADPPPGGPTFVLRSPLHRHLHRSRQKRFPSAPRILQVLAVSPGPGVPQAPGVSHVVGIPQAPGLSHVPEVAQAPGVSQILGVPLAHGVPQVPGVPQAPGVSQVSGIPQAFRGPHAPEVPQSNEHTRALLPREQPGDERGAGLDRPEGRNVTGSLWQEGMRRLGAERAYRESDPPEPPSLRRSLRFAGVSR